MLDASLGYSRRDAIKLTGLLLLILLGWGFLIGLGVGFALGFLKAMHVATPAWLAPSQPWFTIATNSATFAIGLSYGLRKMRAGWPEFLAGRHAPPVLYALTLVAFVGLVIVYSELSNLTFWLVPAPAFIRNIFSPLANLGENPVSAPLLLVVVAPLTEELFFRGLILRRLLATRTRSQAIWTSALLFMAFHLNPWQFPVALLIGLVLGWLYARTRSLGVCIAAHGFFNGTMLIATGLPFQIQGFNAPHDPSLLVFQPWWLDLLGAALLAAGLFLLARATQPAAVPPVIVEPPLLASRPDAEGP